MNRLGVGMGVAFVLVGSLLIVFATEDAAAHRQGLRTGYERMLYDCSHDYGWESGIHSDWGHDLNTLDVMESVVDGVAVVFIEVTMNRERKDGTVNGPMKETVRFETPRRLIETTINTTIEHKTPLVEEGLQPFRLLEPRHGIGMYGQEPHDESWSYNLVYTYEQLQVRSGEALTGFEVQGYYTRDGQWRKGDYMAGGRAFADGSETELCKHGKQPKDDQTYYVASGFLVQKSNWVPAAPGDNALPVADFRFEPARPKPGEAVHFQDLSYDPDGHVVAWSWTFGDGSTSTERHPVHTYTADGRYIVSLRVTDDRGAFAQLGREVRIGDPAPPPGQDEHPPEAPVAGFEFHPRQPMAGEEVTFVDASYDPDGTVVAWAWSFGNGAQGSDYTVVHRYEEAGRYEVTLKVTDNDGLSSTITKDLVVASSGAGSSGPGQPVPPAAGLAYHPTGPSRLSAVQFSDTSHPGDAPLIEWRWSFGDGNTSTERHPEHRFGKTGLHHVRLEVVDANGLAAFVRQEILVVNLPPVADFVVEPTAPRPGETVRLIDRSKDPDGRVVAWDWYLGDGRSRFSQSPSVSFDRPGEYLVVMTVTDDDGATDTKVHRLVVSSFSSGGAGVSSGQVADGAALDVDDETGALGETGAGESAPNNPARREASGPTAPLLLLMLAATVAYFRRRGM